MKGAAAYCRVSTKALEQLDSLAAQERYYEDRIKSNPNWQFAGIYSDVGRRKCYGYKHDKAGHLVIDEAKAEVVRIIFHMADEGASLAQIAQILQEQSIPTPRGEAVWSRETLRKILQWKILWHSNGDKDIRCRLFKA